MEMWETYRVVPRPPARVTATAKAAFVAPAMGALQIRGDAVSGKIRVIDSALGGMVKRVDLFGRCKMG